MKLTNRILLIATLAVHSYFPICMAISQLAGLNLRPELPIVPAVITLLVTLAATVFAFLYTTPSTPNKIITLISAPLAALNFAYYFIYTDSAAAIIMLIVCYVSVAVLTVKTNKSIFTRILIPILLIALGLFTFVLSLVFAIVIGLSTPNSELEIESPDGSYRAELYKKSVSSYKNCELKLFKKADEAKLPFVHLSSDGKTAWSGEWSEDIEIFWQDGDTLVINGTVIETAQFFN